MSTMMEKASAKRHIHLFSQTIFRKAILIIRIGIKNACLCRIGI